MLGTINIWLLIGFIIAIVYLLWQVSLLGRAIVEMAKLNQFMMSHLNDALEQRDEKVDQEIERLNAQMEYMNDKDSTS